MNAEALIAAVAVACIGLAAGIVQVRSARRRHAPPPLPAETTLPAETATPSAAPPSSPLPLPLNASSASLPPRDHFALSHGDGSARPLPSGTVTLLFTDIVGSTRLWQEYPDTMGAALARHDALLHALIARHHGHVFKTVGDAFHAVFAAASDGAAAALAAQQAMRAEAWHPHPALLIRLALHSGEAEQRGGDYFGTSLSRAARIVAAGHGGQILVSDAACGLLQALLPPGATLRSLGRVRLRDLAQPEPVHQLLHPDLDSDFPPLRSLDTFPNNLPQPATRFIGREPQLLQIKELLTQTRLLTLLGAGGSGKSRLAVQAAADCLDRFPDGVWLVELAALTDEALVAREVARILHVPEDGNTPVSELLAQALAAKQMLLILDNCEHLPGACADLAARLLRECPWVRVLATSRQALRAPGEQVYPVPTLGLPPGGGADPDTLARSECARLFVDRARLQQPAFQITPANASAVAEICVRLDGIPLAIELGATRVGALTVEEINSRLDNRFRLLTGGARTALPRQQTLRALVDWSYNLLDGSEQALLRRLSVFSGGWTLEAAETICIGDNPSDANNSGDIWEALDGLVDKSLAVAEPGADGHTRYRLLETVRRYSRDCLDTAELPALTDRHRHFFLSLAEEATLHLFGPQQGEWLDKLQADHDNLRAAQDACLADTRCTEDALSLAAALRPFWLRRGAYREGLERSIDALAHAEGSPQTERRADVFLAAGTLARQMGNYPQAQHYLERGLTVCRALSYQKRLATTLAALGNLAQTVGEYARARDLYAEGLALSREIGDTLNAAYGLVSLGQAQYRLGEFDAARAAQEQALQEMRALQTDDGIAFALGNLASVALAQGDTVRAGDTLREGLRLYQHMDNKHGIASALDSLAALALSELMPHRSVRLLAACAALSEVLGVQQMPADQAQFDAMCAQAQTLLSPDIYTDCWQQGHALSADAAAAYALSVGAEE